MSSFLVLSVFELNLSVAEKEQLLQVQAKTFFGGLLSKEVFNTMAAFFYTKYESAGFIFDYLKCYNVKQLDNIKNRNQKTVNGILTEAKEFLTKKEISDLRPLMENRNQEDRENLVNKYFEKNNRTGKFYKRFLRVVKSGSFYVIRFTSINVDATMFPIITMIEFRSNMRIRIDISEDENLSELSQVNALWACARDEVLTSVLKAGTRKWAKGHEAELSDLLDESSGNELDDGADLVNLTDLLASIHDDLDEMELSD